MKPSPKFLSEQPVAAHAKVRPFEDPDISAVCELDAICFPPAIAYSPEEIADILMQRGSICYVADASGRVVAWIVGLARSGAGQIVTIDVHPEFQRLGIGNSLMTTLEDDFRRRGCARARLEVDTGNTGAQQFYQRRGYKIIRTISRYYANGNDAFRMERTL